ncbi:MAG: hypothetical protein J3K34DRAFT_461474 [Monoraphidium minutum]|nr:MAG: hypothetical protein J3K34DRAFT_461474 [Monoraphidium minutum]
MAHTCGAWDDSARRVPPPAPAFAPTARQALAWSQDPAAAWLDDLDIGVSFDDLLADLAAGEAAPPAAPGSAGGWFPARAAPRDDAAVVPEMDAPAAAAAAAAAAPPPPWEQRAPAPHGAALLERMPTDELFAAFDDALFAATPEAALGAPAAAPAAAGCSQQAAGATQPQQQLLQQELPPAPHGPGVAAAGAAPAAPRPCDAAPRAHAQPVPWCVVYYSVPHPAACYYYAAQGAPWGAPHADPTHHAATPEPRDRCCDASDGAAAAPAAAATARAQLECDSGVDEAWRPAAGGGGGGGSGGAAGGAAALAALAAAGVGSLSRAQRVLRYRLKRQRRRFEKTIRYAARRAHAEVRPRIRGRFVKPEELAAWRAAEGAMAAGEAAAATLLAGGDACTAAPAAEPAPGVVPMV